MLALASLPSGLSLLMRGRDPATSEASERERPGACPPVWSSGWQQGVLSHTDG